MRRAKLLILSLTLLLVLAVPAISLAQDGGNQNDIINVPVVGLAGEADADFEGSVENLIVNILLPISGIIAVFFIIVGGFQYMFAGMNEKLAAQGKNTLRNAVIGLIIIILSYVIITVVVNTLFDI
jgi:hypothetical protein